MVQAKGFKAVTHAKMQTTLEGCMRTAVFNMQDRISGLDWMHIKDRTKGELFCDVGVTILAVGCEPLVGLWRLDSLDASFGAGGYRSGTMHTLNTLSLFGGLQAESLPDRRLQTHIAFRSAYNLAYEATRKSDNSRELFDEKMVFRRDPQFRKDMDSVQRIYKEVAPRTSYGVRDEFRVGGRALPDIEKCIEEAVGTPVCRGVLLLTTGLG